MSSSASLVSSLRMRTGVSILECKKALDEAGDDEEKAIEILRKRGLSQAAKKAARDQFEGLVFLAQKEGKAALVLLKCETDFVARADDFRALGEELASLLLTKGTQEVTARADAALPAIVQKLGENISIGAMETVEAPVLGVYLHTNRKIGVLVGLSGGSAETAKDVAMHAAAMNPRVVAPTDVTADLVEKEKEVWREQLKKEGKPEQIWDKIMGGKEKKFREEHALLSQPFVKDPSMTVQKFIGDAKVQKYVRLAVK